MKAKVSTFRKLLREEFRKMLQKEDVDRLRRAKDGYGETEFEEDVDRLRRAKDGYGETEFEESLDEAPPMPALSGPSSELSKNVSLEDAIDAILDSVGLTSEDPAVASKIKRMDQEQKKKLVQWARKHRKALEDLEAASEEPGMPALPRPSLADEAKDEEEEKKKRAKSHAHPSDVEVDAGSSPVAGEGYDTASGRDPKETEPFDRGLKTPVYNMSDEEDDEGDVPLFGERCDDLEESKLSLSSMIKK